jgi:hypothetical protein
MPNEIVTRWLQNPVLVALTLVVSFTFVHGVFAENVKLMVGGITMSRDIAIYKLPEDHIAMLWAI